MQCGQCQHVNRDAARFCAACASPLGPTWPDAAQAAACFHQALDVARQQQAKSRELRAATSLARLWQSQNKRQDAYACWRRCMRGSPRGLIRRISKRRRHCWTNSNPKDITCEV